MSSSESEHENLKRFAESVDVTMFSNKLYSKTDHEEKEEPKVELKSQRELETEENIFQSEVNVSSSMQTFIGKKLSKLIESQIEFVNVESVATSDDDQGVDNMRLLLGSKKTVKFIHEAPFVENRKKVAIKRRCIEEVPQEAEKFEVAAIEVDEIEKEVKHWTKKPRHQPFEYKIVKGTAYLREPVTEFSNARKKNNWTEAKIKTANYHNPPLCCAIKR